MVLLEKLLTNIPYIKIEGKIDIKITGIACDTRKIKNSNKNLYIALRGNNFDGHQFINEAISLGSNVIFLEKLPETLNKDVAYVIVKNTKAILSQLASNFYNNPSSKLKLIGVTGTNGKTTTCTLLYHLFQSLGYKCGLISTIHNIIDTAEEKSEYTTPDVFKINDLLYDMVEKGCKFCFMEVSSHAIDQQRIEGLKFEGGVFLNITQDHLDYHLTFQNYINSKKAFFDNLNKNAFALYNSDDPNGIVMMQNSKAKKYSFSLKNKANFSAKILNSTLDYTELKIDNQNVHTKFPGSFNAYNFLAAYVTAIILGENSSEILLKLSNSTPPKGRFNIIPNEKGIYPIIDYAHTPDALQKVLSAISQSKEKDSMVITVIGCGGNRDKDKRPMMGRIASKLSNKAIFTSDNPRNEDPIDIINDMIEGVSESEKNNIITIVNRREAIKTACLLAQKGDIVLIAGKGHEDYQEINSIKFEFDDVKVVKEFL